MLSHFARTATIQYTSMELASPAQQQRRIIYESIRMRDSHIARKRTEFDIRFCKLHRLLNRKSDLILANKRLLYVATFRTIPTRLCMLFLWGGTASNSIRNTIQRFQNLYKMTYYSRTYIFSTVDDLIRKLFTVDVKNVYIIIRILRHYNY